MALSGALRATLAAPATWPLALGAFLIRGGILLVALPILVLPTPVGLGDIIAPALTSIAFGSVSTGMVVSIAAIVVVGLGWILAGGWLAPRSSRARASSPSTKGSGARSTPGFDPPKRDG